MPCATASSSCSCKASEALAITATPKPSPDPTAGQGASGPPSAAVTTPPASATINPDAATSYGKLVHTAPSPATRNAESSSGSSCSNRQPMSTYASSCPVTMRVMLKVAEPRSK
jgi:hypothetical protein